MDNGQDNAVPQLQPPLSQESIQKFLTLQQNELDIRAREIAVKSQEEENRKHIAEKSISANLQDRQSERSHVASMGKYALGTLIIICALFTAFACYALTTQNGNIVLEIVKLMVTFLAGLAGGYGAKAAQDKKDPPSQA